MYLLIFGSLVGLVALYFCYVVFWCQTYWKRRGIYSLQSTIFLGNMGPALLRKKTLKDIVLDMYNEALRKNLKFAGMYLSTVPELLLADPELVREITVKQFDHFTDRQPIISKKNVDDLLARSILSLQGDEWRKMRHNLSPAFTGSKLRGMIELMVQIGEQYSRFLVNRADQDEPLDMKNVFRRFTADVIATTAFGTHSNSIDDSDAEFYYKGQSMMDFKGMRQVVVMGYVIAPKLMSALKIPFLPRELKEFFTKIISGNIKYREENNKSRPDMIQLLLDERKSQKQKLKEMGHPVTDQNVLSDADILAQAFTFFLGGFETVAAVATLTCMMLGGLPDVQEKLRNEVDEAFAQTADGKLKYEDIQGMKYLDMVLSEVLRFLPIAPMGDRVCNKELDLPEFNLKIKKGEICAVPFYAFHMDPRYFENPEEFIPERFSDENKHKIAPFTYMPFGSGPRNCIGNRFALLEVKIALIYTLALCEVHLNSPEQYPIKFDPKKIDNAPFGGFLLKMKLRENPPIDTEKLKK